MSGAACAIRTWAVHHSNLSHHLPRWLDGCFRWLVSPLHCWITSARHDTSKQGHNVGWSSTHMFFGRVQSMSMKIMEFLSNRCLSKAANFFARLNPLSVASCACVGLSGKASDYFRERWALAMFLPLPWCPYDRGLVDVSGLVPVRCAHMMKNVRDK